MRERKVREREVREREVREGGEREGVREREGGERERERHVKNKKRECDYLSQRVWRKSFHFSAFEKCTSKRDRRKERKRENESGGSERMRERGGQKEEKERVGSERMIERERGIYWHLQKA